MIFSHWPIFIRETVRKHAVTRRTPRLARETEAATILRRVFEERYYYLH